MGRIQIPTFNGAKKLHAIISEHFFKDAHMLSAAEAMRTEFKIPHLEFAVFGEPEGEVQANIQGRKRGVLFHYLSRLSYEKTPRSHEFYLDDFWRELATGNQTFEMIKNFLNDTKPHKSYDMMYISQPMRGLSIISETAVNHSWVYAEDKKIFDQGNNYILSTMAFTEGKPIQPGWHEQKTESKAIYHKTQEEMLKFIADYFHLAISSTLAKKVHSSST